ncbi:MAG: ABC transporter substrate-binding protein [Magnetococcales bacterium]|nr:ABC transporter substrate-binding protein [Magnetococcales bacterium]
MVLDVDAASKRVVFLRILAGAVAVACVVSLVIYLTFLKKSHTDVVQLVVVGPHSGKDASIGRAMLSGAQLLADQTNRAGGVRERQVKVVEVDETSDPARLRQTIEEILRQPSVLGVVGYWSTQTVAPMLDLLAKYKVPLLALAMGQPGDLSASPWLFQTAFDEVTEARFLANYVRNIVGEKTVSIIREQGRAGEVVANAFDETMQRFGTKILSQWTLDPASPTVAADIDRISAEIKEKKLIGTLFYHGDTALGAHTLAALRQAGVRNKWIGLRNLATTSFTEHLARFWKGEGSASSALHGMLVTTPLLFDTAGEIAQSFRSTFIDAYKTPPDWVAANAFDAAKLLVTAFREAPFDNKDQPESVRDTVRNLLTGHDRLERAFDGTAGPIFFDNKQIAAPTTMVGIQDGGDLVAAMTQLWPIREEGVSNYLEEIVNGRALYVNDRFMYKTNVVYTGIRIEKIAGLDLAANVAELDMTIWFRWRGKFDPQDVTFTNAVVPVKLEKPDREEQSGDIAYRSYRVSGRFFLNYSKAERAYGTQLVGAVFRHRILNRNNLMYVSDVLGMNLTGRSSLTSHLKAGNLTQPGKGGQTAEEGLFAKLKGMIASGGMGIDPLVDLLVRSRVLAALSGWLVERAWVSQDYAIQTSQGAPQFVGFGKASPMFSRLDMGIVLRPDGIDARDVIPKNMFIFLAIFSLIGAMLPVFLDRKDRGEFWKIQSLGLRLVCWPLLLLSAGNLSLDYALNNFSTANIDMVLLVYRVLWWLVPARLMGISLERFVWTPLERRSGRKIPNVVRLIVSLCIYLFAIFGVVAFVFDKTLTSLLATTGLTAMVIGLAIQANIANVFSGIVLNLERPFSIGDLIKINNLSGQVVDITWRTTRIESFDGQMVSLPNGKVSEAEVHNFSRANGINTGTRLFLDPRHDPAQIVEQVKVILEGLKEIVINNADQEPVVFFVGVECVNGHWVAAYDIRFSILSNARRRRALQELWTHLWNRFHETGIRWQELDESFIPVARLQAAQESVTTA